MAGGEPCAYPCAPPVHARRRLRKARARSTRLRRAGTISTAVSQSKPLKAGWLQPYPQNRSDYGYCLSFTLKVPSLVETRSTLLARHFLSIDLMGGLGRHPVVG